MLKLSLKKGQYVNIGDDIRIVFAGGTGKQLIMLIDGRGTCHNPESRLL